MLGHGSERAINIKKHKETYRETQRETQRDSERQSGRKPETETYCLRHTKIDRKKTKTCD